MHDVLLRWLIFNKLHVSFCLPGLTRSAPLTPGRFCPRTWWSSEAQPCCLVSCTGCWPRYASWWRSPSTATCWPARASASTRHLPNPTAPPGSEVRGQTFGARGGSPQNYCVTHLPQLFLSISHNEPNLLQFFTHVLLLYFDTMHVKQLYQNYDTLR